MRARLVPVTLLLLAAAACGGAGSDRIEAAAGGPPPLPDRARISSEKWSHPGGPTAKRTSLADAKRTGALPFDPPRVRIAKAPASVEVTDPARTPEPHRAFFAVYDFGATSTEFRGDGRLVVSMVKTDATVETFREMARVNTPDYAWEMVRVAGQEALLVQTDDRSVARLIHVRNGYEISITGPAVDATTVLKYAAQVL